MTRIQRCGIAMTLLLAQLPGCSGVSDQSRFDAGDLDAEPSTDAGPLIPELGLWRGLVDTAPFHCDLGWNGFFTALFDQYVLELTAASGPALTWLPAGSTNPVVCTKRTENTYGCAPETVTNGALDGNMYTVTASSTFTVTGPQSATAAIGATVTCEGASCASSDPCHEEATYSFSHFVENETLLPKDCGLQSALAAPGVYAQTFIDFHNAGSSPANLYFLNHAAIREDRGSVAPGQTARMVTYKDHSWVVADASGNCLSIYTAVADIGLVTIN